MTTETHSLCETCGLAMPATTTTGRAGFTKQTEHLTLQDCIRALRRAMLSQRLAAEQLGMDMSIHFLRVFEELSIDPDVGLQYTVWDEREGKNLVMPAKRVSGVFASILKKYRETADFSFHEHEVRVTRHWARAAGGLAGHMLKLVDKYEVDAEDRAEAERLMAEAQVKPPESRPLDPSSS